MASNHGRDYDGRRMTDRHEYSLTEAYQAPTENHQGDPNQARLLVISGPMNGVTFGLAPGHVSLGRRDDNGICLPLSGVSKLHCSFEVEATGRITIRDEQSKNGTDVNSRPLQPGSALELSHGDSIRICDTAMFFLNPRGATTQAYEAAIDVDFGAAALEADSIIEQCAELVALRRSRRGEA